LNLKNNEIEPYKPFLEEPPHKFLTRLEVLAERKNPTTLKIT
jgi:hypothetical protein